MSQQYGPPHGPPGQGGWGPPPQQFRPPRRSGKTQWIVIKHADETAGSPVPADRSVLTGRTMEEIQKAADAVWSSKTRVA